MFADPSLPEPASQPAASGPVPAVETELQDFDELRRILLGVEQARLARWTEDVDDLQQLMADREALAAIIAPTLDEALRDKIQQNRD